MTNEKRVSQDAVDLMAKGHMCSQSVLAVFAPRFGLDTQTAIKISVAFGGGMGQGWVCGAVTGAYMVLGLAYGDKEVGSESYAREAKELIKRFNSEFERRRGSLICQELLGVNPNTPEGAAQAREKNLFQDVCPNLVRDAALILEDILADGL